MWNFPQTCSVQVPVFLGVLGTQYPKLDGLSECDKHPVMVSQIAATTTFLRIPPSTSNLLAVEGCSFHTNRL